MSNVPLCSSGSINSPVKRLMKASFHLVNSINATIYIYLVIIFNDRCYNYVAIDYFYCSGWLRENIAVKLFFHKKKLM